MTTEPVSRVSWRTSSVTRVFGSAFGWFSGALALTLLFQAVSALADLGGFCARGGPYEIAVECTDAIVVFAPSSILGGLIALAVAAVLAGGFGASFLVFAWPALFVSLSVTFFRTFVQFGDFSGLIVGVLFVVMGLAPLVLVLRAAPQRLLLGRVDARGRAFWEAHPAQPHLLSLTRPKQPGENHPTAGDWIVSISIALVGTALGVWLGVLWFGVVAGA